MACEIVISPFAQDDVYKAYEWYEQKLAGLGEEFLNELETAYHKIAEHPEYYSFIDDKKDLRDYMVHRFPFLIVYRINGNVIKVITVHYAKKHPQKKYGYNI